MPGPIGLPDGPLFSAHGPKSRSLMLGGTCYRMFQGDVVWESEGFGCLSRSSSSDQSFGPCLMHPSDPPEILPA
jgi:hypothetical protein